MFRPPFTGGELGAELSPAELESLRLPGFSKGRERDESWGRTESGTILREEKGTREEVSSEVELNRPFVLGEALPVVPAKMVKRILKGEFVDMAELLKDNVEAERRRAAGNESSRRTTMVAERLVDTSR